MKFDNRLKELLEQVRSSSIKDNRADKDPVRFPRWLYEQKRPEAEIEAAAVFSAMMAYGSAEQFIKKIEAAMDGCQWQFLRLITSPEDCKAFNWPQYRLSTSKEIGMFAGAVGSVINTHGSLKNVFLSGFNADKTVRSGLSALRTAIVHEAEKLVSPLPHGLLHLLPNPDSGGCAKRWQMFLRWMVRPDDGIDMHLWSEVSPSVLLIPLDRHISRIARNLGLTSRKADDWKTAEEVSASLALFCSEDPIRYDFSLCHLGIAGKCNHGKDKELCESCAFTAYCSKGENLA